MSVVTTITPTPGSTLSPPWQSEQEPQVRGVTQNRITAVSGAAVPGAGVYKPSVAMRVELRSEHAGDFTVTATAAATAASTTLTMSTTDVARLVLNHFLVNTRTTEIVRVNGTPSGTTVPVNRGRPNSTAAAVNAGDTFTVISGDVNDSGSDYATSRAEVYGRFASSSTVDPTLWPDPVYSERWYSWSIYLPADYATSTDGTMWLSTTQWKGAFTGSPPVGMEIKRDWWQFGGLNGYGITNGGNLGTITRGAWTHFLVGMKLNPDPAIGWVEIYRDGALVIPKVNVATMNYKTSTTLPDPTYLKQGIYRDGRWTDTHVVYYSPITIATSKLDFGLADSPPVVSGVASQQQFWGVRA